MVLQLPTVQKSIFMKKTIKKIVGVLSLLLAGLSSSVFAEINFWTDAPNDQLADYIVNEMTDEELYSQILMFGWAGAEPSALLNDWVDRGLGSVKVFGWNTDDIYQVAKSISSVQKKASAGRFKIPLFVATDQEGGWIRHVKGNTSITPGNMAIGASGYISDSWYSAYYISKEIKCLGINMNFAPTVDLFTDHDSTIIGSRSFGEDPNKSGILGAAWAAGSIAAGVIPTVKHFPGHGDTPYDSHVFLPEVNIDWDTFSNRELVPFSYLVKAGVPAVMSRHLAFPQIDKSGAPASLSKYFLTDLLRNQMGYQGLIITDDMMMNGATLYAGSLSSAFRMAIEAGNDIILSSTTARLNEALWTVNLKLMQTDEAFKARVKDAARRVILSKLEYFKSDNAAPLYPDPSQSNIDKQVPDKEGELFFLEQACRSITVYKNTANLIPATEKNSGNTLLVGALPEFFAEGKSRYPKAKEFRFNYELGPNETQWVCDNILATAKSYDTIIINVANERHATIANKLRESGKKIIILSIMSPVFAEKLEWADTIIMGYSWSDWTFKAMMGALAGEYKATGEAPFIK